jgi:glucose/arabinose dehydrogenase
MKKKLLQGTLLLALIVVATWAGLFYWRNLRGVAPAIFAAAPDSALLVRQGKSPLTYPPEFAVHLFADGLSGARVMAFDPRGAMLVSMPAAGKVVALPDDDNNGRADRVVEVVTGLNRPHGLAFSKDPTPRLYVGEKDRVTAYDYDPAKMRASAGQKICDLPAGGGHSTRTILFRPPPDEDQLLISVGSSCNACRETDWRRAKILVIDKDGGQLQTFASGLRNAVFMRAHPATGEIWATEMGRDYLGDDLPPDEINIIKRGHDYGWPDCYGNNVPDAESPAAAGVSGACRDKTPSFLDIQAHSAPLGLDFFPSQGWPPQYRNAMLVAYHGSWNRTVPTGYKIVLYRFAERDNLLDRRDFITGWLGDEKESSSGRPVDIRIMPQGLIYISDDKAGVIYRLRRQPET